MKISVEVLSHPPLHFSAALPQNFAGERLGGSTIISATGSFGSLCMQEFQTPDFVLRYTVIDANQAFTARFKSRFEGLHSFIIQQGNLKAEIKDFGIFEIHEGQFTLVHASEPEALVEFREKECFIFFEVLLTDVTTIEILSEFNGMNFNLSSHRPEVWVNPAQFIDEEVKDHIRYILTYADNPDWRQNYYTNRAWDICWKLIALHGEQSIPESSVTTDEKRKAEEVRKLIVENLDKHLLVREIARMVGLSESRLKKIFSKVYDIGIHEYRIQQRLKKAIELIESGKSVKEAAGLTGWRSANLIKAYYKIYHTTPGRIRPKKK